jgi:hypothetical protein
MGCSYYIAIERNGNIEFADKYRDSSEYIPALLRAARLVDEKIPDALLMSGNTATRGFVGGIYGGNEWEKPETWRTREKQEVHILAETARAVGLNYE